MLFHFALLGYDISWSPENRSATSLSSPVLSAMHEAPLSSRLDLYSPSQNSDMVNVEAYSPLHIAELPLENVKQILSFLNFAYPLVECFPSYQSKPKSTKLGCGGPWAINNTYIFQTYDLGLIYVLLVRNGTCHLIRIKPCLVLTFCISY